MIQATSSAQLLENISEVAQQFASQRQARQKREHLERDDFDQLHKAGFTRLAVPKTHGGFWESPETSALLRSQALRILAGGEFFGSFGQYHASGCFVLLADCRS